MSGIKWSDEQLKAIEHSTARDGSAIVSAAAGSGKTAMLVERITRLLTSEEPKIPADKIVAVTFTNDAAGELKTRLENAVNDVLSKSNSPWLKEQLINLENAFISTISSFCVNLLRDYAEELNLKSDFKICEGKEAERLSEQALDYALEAIYDSVAFSTKEKNTLRGITGEAGDSKLGRAVLELHKEYTKQPFPEKWLAEKIAVYDRPDSAIAEESRQKIKANASACLEYINECIKLSYNEKMTAKLMQDKAFAESWKNGAEGLLEYGNSYYGNVSEQYKSAKESIKKIRDMYIPVFKEIIITAGLLSDFNFIIEKQAPQISVLARLFRLYEEKFRELKTERNCVDFSDAEHYVLKLLENKQIAETIQNSFYEIIVDEFQDSNAVQYEIFKGLSKNSKNLFFVGDVKQSIYRFRNADQRVFVSVTEDENFTVLTLNKNYRSSKNVVDSVNEIFGVNMTREVGGVNYDDSAKLIFGRENDGSKTELVLTENEADYIAERIEDMVESGFEIEGRACNYGDFAVLISGLSTVEEEFSAAFEARGIPYDKQKSGDYAEVPEIKTIIALLTVIEKPFEDMELLSVLMSPLYNFTAGDIADIRKSGVNRPLFENVGGDSISARFTEDWRRWSAYSKNHGASKLIRLIYDEGGFNPLAAASINPEKTMINIRLLLHYSESLKSLTGDTLSGLVNTLGGQGGAALEEARFSAETETSRVKLMTIHASKGLEFPVCFVARTNARFNLRENYSDIIFSDNIGFALRYIIPETRTRCDTLLHKKAREENQAAAISEEMRKLYVACTRAKEKLILTADSDGEKVTEKSYLNWLIKANIDVKSVGAVGEPPDENNRPAIPGGLPSAPTEDETQDIINAINKTYSRELLTTIPRRFTATQIGVKEAEFSALEDMQDEPTIFPRSASFMGNRKLTGKKRGDAYHKMMELIDFKAGDFDVQMKNLKTRFTEEEFAAVEPEKIAGFFNSALGKRAAASPKVQKEFMLCTEISLSELGYPKEYDELFDEKSFVQGIADMFFYEDDEIILVDYKTNKNTARSKLIEQYEKQLEIYALAIEEMTGYRVREKWIYSFELGEIRLA